MNCQEVIGILDNQRVDQLDCAQRRQAEAHVAACADCARAWHAQSSLATLPDMAVPADFAAHCRVAVAARSGAANGGRARRVLLWGSFTAVAAAAAALVLSSGPTVRTVARQAAQVPRSEAGPPAVGATPAVQPSGTAGVAQPAQPAPAVAKAAAPRFTVQVVVPEPLPADPASPFQVEQKEMYAIATDPAAQEALQSLRAGLVAELARIPGLAVLDKDPVQIAPTSRHYRVRLAPDVMIGLDGRPTRLEHGYAIGIDVKEVQSGGATINHRLPIMGFGVDPQATCASPDAAGEMPCDAQTTAIFLARYLRQHVFPADASVTQPLQAKFRDSSQAPEDRFKAFVELFKLQAKNGGKGLLGDPGVVHATVELSQLTDAEHRAQLWRAMRGVGDAALVEPLLASMQQDPESARIAAAETLAADFGSDPRARSALETTAISDPDPLVRAVAQRGLTGDEGWNHYVLSSLKDSSRPDSGRVAALMYELYPPLTIEGVSDPSPSNYWQILKGLDDAAVRSLAEIFPRAEMFRHWPSNNLLGNFVAVHDKDPVVTDLLLTVLKQDSHDLNRAVAAQELAEAHASEPRVREALLNALSNDPSASVRDDLGKLLQKDYVKKAMGQ